MDKSTRVQIESAISQYKVALMYKINDIFDSSDSVDVKKALNGVLDLLIDKSIDERIYSDNPYQE